MYRRVKEALFGLAGYFESETVIKGIRATDLFTLNSPLSTAIEDQVVETLNKVRKLWDPDEKYGAYSFYRQPQTFPDVVLKRYQSDGKPDILLGVELKGWYLLSKEGEPSLRFVANKDACAPQDLICIVPWALSELVSGTPRIFKPWLGSASWAAEYRTFYWQQGRKKKGGKAPNTEIRFASGAKPYPSKSAKTSDEAVSDPGRNFGRLARTGIMTDYVQATLTEPLSGIEARHWLEYFRSFKENATPEDIQACIERLRENLGKGAVVLPDEDE